MSLDLDELVRTTTLSRPRRLARPRARLEVVAGRDAGRSLEFDGRARIGARPLADLVLRDSKVSGLHCEISVGEQLRVRDLGSKNGTFARGVQVLDAIVASGEILSLGRSQVRVVALEQLVDIPLHEDTDFHGMVGQSAAIRALTAKLAQLASADTTVLVLGETGTGKECVAEALHRAGARASAPLVILDCAALPAALIEAELFGFERGAFTGAVAAQAGVFERADGGTLFIDEVGELPLDLQPKLLRALEARQVRRLGGERTIAFDARIVAATNRDLPLEVARGQFREDLYWRLAVATVTVPPLRDRLEDLPLLASHLLRQMGVDPADVLTLDALEELARHGWPGNVRELRNTLERASATGGPPAVERARPEAPAPAAIDLGQPFRIGKQRVIDDYERAYMSALVEQYQGNVAEIARHAGMDRMSIYRILQRLQLSRERGRR
jgi:transcriptional regulator with GAF, ATPase, and Fis domain